MTRYSFLPASLLAFCVAIPTAQAGLIIDVSGVAGSGDTTWVFTTVTPGTASVDGTIRDASNATFNAADTGQFPFGLDTILDTSIQDTVFSLSGNATVTVGGNSQLITGIFLDDDGGSADDLGIRTFADLAYLAGDTSSWTGSGTVNIDISAFALGSWSLNSSDGQAMFIDDPIIVNFIETTAVPAPASLALLGIGALAWGLGRRRR